MTVEAPVERVTAAAYRIPTDAPEADGTLEWDATTVVIATVTAGGQTGLGASYTADVARQLIERTLAPVVTGRCALDVTAAYHAMCRAVRNIGRPGIAATASSAVDIALWDLKARLLAVPLARLLGVVHDAVPVYGSGGFTSYDDQQLTAQFATWVHDEGIPGGHLVRRAGVLQRPRRPARSTASRPTSPAAASPNGSAWPPPPPTFATWNGSTTTSASSQWSSTGLPLPPPAGFSRRTCPRRDTD